MEAYQQDIWRIVVYVLIDTSAAEDLVQEVFVQAWFSIDAFKEGRDFGPWLRTIARNAVRKELRRQMREDRRVATYQERVVARMEDGEAHQQRDAQLRDALAACRKKLSTQASQALDLRYERGQGFDAIAETLGRTVAAARQLLTRTRVTLRECVEFRLRPDA